MQKPVYKKFKMNEDLLSTEKRSFTTIFKSKKEHLREEEEQADFLEGDPELYQQQATLKKVNTEKIMEKLVKQSEKNNLYYQKQKEKLKKEMQALTIVKHERKPAMHNFQPNPSDAILKLSKPLKDQDKLKQLEKAKA